MTPACALIMYLVPLRARSRGARSRYRNTPPFIGLFVGPFEATGLSLPGLSARPLQGKGLALPISVSRKRIRLMDVRGLQRRGLSALRLLSHWHALQECQHVVDQSARMAATVNLGVFLPLFHHMLVRRFSHSSMPVS